MKLEELGFYRSPSHKSTTRVLPLVPKYRDISLTPWYKTPYVVQAFHSLIGFVTFSTMARTCQWITHPSKMLVSTRLTQRVTGTLFGNKMGHISFAVQENPRSVPVLLVELATPTGTLVRAISSGLVRISLQCEKGSGTGPRTKLLQEPMWTMYCNGKKCGYAVSRTCVESDRHLLSTVQTVKAGAGIIPTKKSLGGRSGEGEVMYMRTRFERVVGNLNSETYNMMNMDGSGGVDQLSIFLIRM